MLKEITVDPYSPMSIDFAIAEVRRHEKWVKEKSMELCKRLAEIGANVASIHFSSGFLDENDDVTVTVRPINNGYSVVANGQSVCFLEFGTGVAAGNGYDTSEIHPPVPIEPGSWSGTKGTGEFAKYGSWHYNKRKYTMTTPRMGMYHASVETKRVMEKIAQEVFGS